MKKKYPTKKKAATKKKAMRKKAPAKKGSSPGIVKRGYNSISGRKKSLDDKIREQGG